MTTNSDLPPSAPSQKRFSIRTYPQPSAILELLKPITWFPPMWAFACGVVSSGQPILANWRIALTSCWDPKARLGRQVWSWRVPRSS